MHSTRTLHFLVLLPLKPASWKPGFPSGTSNYGFIIKAISTSRFTQLSRFSLIYDTSATTYRTWQWHPMNFILRTIYQMVAAINESTPCKFYSQISSSVVILLLLEYFFKSIASNWQLHFRWFSKDTDETLREKIIKNISWFLNPCGIENSVLYLYVSNLKLYSSI